MIRNFAFYSYVHFFLIHSFLSNLRFVNGLSFISVNTVQANQEQKKENIEVLSEKVDKQRLNF